MGKEDTELFESLADVLERLLECRTGAVPARLRGFRRELRREWDELSARQRERLMKDAAWSSGE